MTAFGQHGPMIGLLASLPLAIWMALYFERVRYQLGRSDDEPIFWKGAAWWGEKFVILGEIMRRARQGDGIALAWTAAYWTVILVGVGAPLVILAARAGR